MDELSGLALLVGKSGKGHSVGLACVHEGLGKFQSFITKSIKHNLELILFCEMRMHVNEVLKGHSE